MEPEDTRSHISRKIDMTMPFSSSDSNLHSVQKIQTSHRRKKREIMSEEYDQHNCSSSSAASVTGRTMCSSIRSSILSSSSSSSLVLFLLISALLLFTCVSPIQSLPFDGRSLSSSNGGGSSSSSHRSHMDLLIDPIHQAEYGDEDPFENTRVVKSVFDMVLRTPPPPTTSTNRCPPGTQRPSEGQPCIKKSTDPVALVDQSFLLDTLRGLAKEGVLLGGPQKSRRPGNGGGNNRRRTPGRPGSRTTSTTTTQAPSMSSAEVAEAEGEIQGEMPTTTFVNNGDSDVVSVAEEKVMLGITQEPEPSTSSSPGTTTVSESEVNEETVIPDIIDKKEEETPSEQLPISSDSTMPPEATAEAVAVTVMTTTSTTTTTTTTTEPPTTIPTTEEAPQIKNGADLKRTAAPETSLPPSPATGNDEKVTVVEAAPTPLALSFIETQSTPTTTATTSIEQQVKSGQVHKEEIGEPLPTNMMTITSPTPISDQLVDTGANNQTGNSNQDHVQNINMQSDSQILESEKKDEHQIQEQPIFLASTPSAPVPSSFIVTSPQPTFPKEEFMTSTATVDITSHQAQDDKIHDHDEKQDSILVSKTSTTSPVSSPSEPERIMMTMTTVNPPVPNGAVGAENHIVTGVITASATDQSHQHQADAQSQIEHVSPAKSPEIPVVSQIEPEKGELKTVMTMMTTRMMKVTTGETPQIRQEDQIKEDDSGSSILPVLPSPLPSVSSTVTEMPPQPKESSSPSMIVSERESQAQQNESMTASILLTREEEESKVSEDAITTSEGTTSATIPSEKVPTRPLGPLDNMNQTETVLVVVEEQQREQVQEQDEMKKAGDTSMMRTEEEEEQQVKKGLNEAEAEQGDVQPSSSADSSSTNAVVNHLKDGDDDNDKEKETVTLQVGDADLAIINGNLPSSVSPVHDEHNHHEDNNNEKRPVIEEAVEQSASEEILLENSPGSREQNQPQENFSEERARDQPVVMESGKDLESPQAVLETTLVPPPEKITTNVPVDTHQFNKFRPSDTLLQFQLPIVTRVPTSSIRNQQADIGHNTFQTFPEFPSVKGTGTVRFPNSGEDIGAPTIRNTFKPVFVQDFHLDYPPIRHDEKQPPPQPPQQQWQIPQPFNAPEPNKAPNQQQQNTQFPEHPLEYYDTGSTEYLESELDRMHQKTRSRNRIRNSPEPSPPTTSTTNQPPAPPILSPEFSFYPPPPHQHQPPPPPQQAQQQQHQPQQSLHFARRNPSSDFFPFGYLNFRTGHDRFHHNNRRLIW